MQKLTAQIGSTEREVTVEQLPDGRHRVVIDGVERLVDARRTDGGYSLIIDGQVHNVDVELDKNGDPVVEIRGRSATVKMLDARRKLLESAAAQARARGASGPQAVRAPMPGKVVKVLCKPGDKVVAGAGLIVVEAMKMENELKAPRDGSVEQVHVSEGQSVEANAPLVTLT